MVSSYKSGQLGYFMPSWLIWAMLKSNELSLPFDRISLEMIYRGLYHFSVAYDKGKAEDPIKYFAATEDPIKYFAAKENQDLGVVKALRKPVSKMDLPPFPAPSQTLVQSL